jgi:hypothetical protein
MLFDEVAELAEPVQNNWLLGLAWTESAAVHAVHGEPAATARMLIKVLDHWESGRGSALLQSIALRYVNRLLVRLGADEDAEAVRRAVAEDRVSAALRLARSSLQRYC